VKEDDEDEDDKGQVALVNEVDRDERSAEEDEEPDALEQDNSVSGFDRSKNGDPAEETGPPHTREKRSSEGSRDVVTFCEDIGGDGGG
jgi:hypothetical protein